LDLRSATAHLAKAVTQYAGDVLPFYLTANINPHKENFYHFGGLAKIAIFEQSLSRIEAEIAEPDDCKSFHMNFSVNLYFPS
jgi:hypothetical protein